MTNEEFDYFVESVGEQLSLVAMTAFTTLVSVGIILFVAL